MILADTHLAPSQYLTPLGVTAIVPKDRLKEYNEICNKWGKNLNFSLSFNKYLHYIRRDVNNYVSESETEIKQKGCFLEKQSLEKGYNTAIIPKAINNYFLKNIPVEETIKAGNNIFDYCLSEKTGNQFVMEYCSDKRVLSRSGIRRV